MNISELMYDLEVESVEDLDDRLLLVECMEVFMWLYDLSNE